MKEWCGCGAGIEGPVKQVKTWRKQHHHPEPTEPEEPQKGGSTAVTQIASYPFGFVRRDEPGGW